PLDLGRELLVPPRVHTGPLDRLLAGEQFEEVRPHVPAEALGLDGREDDRHLEHLRGLRQPDHVVEEELPVDGHDPEGHLRLVVDEDDRAVLRGQQAVDAPRRGCRVCHEWTSESAVRARVVAPPGLSRPWLTVALTVPSVMSRSAAISLLLRPATIRRKTSVSRSVSSLAAARPASLAPIAGGMMVSPRWTRRMQSVSSSGDTSL